MSVAKRYTRALYETLKASQASGDAIEGCRKELIDFAQSIAAAPNAVLALYGPVVSSKEKTSIVKSLCEKLGASQPVTQFLILLARKNRLELLPDVVAAFDEIAAEAEGAVVGEVQSADALGPADLAQLSKAFEQRLGRRVRFRVKVDPSLLAGVKVTVSGVTYDGTLKAQFSRLREMVTVGTSTLLH